VESIFRPGDKIAEIELDQAGRERNASAYTSYIGAINSLNSAKNSYRSSQASLAVVYDAIKGHDTDETLAMKETRTKAEVANDNAYDGIKSAQAKLASAWLSYQLTSPIVTAPIAGNINSIAIVPGMTIDGKIAIIRNESNPLTSFNLSEIDVPRVKIGQKATAILDSLSGKTFTGKVVAVDRIGTTSNNVTSYSVIIQLDTESSEILPNMAANASIIIETKSSVLLVPSAAIQIQGEESLVRVLRNGQEQQMPVQVGLSSDTQTEIISGINEGEEVITGTAIQSSTSQRGSSVFGGGGFGSFGGGALRPGGSRGGVMQH